MSKVATGLRFSLLRRRGISKTNKRLRVNDQIHADQVMVVGAGGEQAGMMSVDAALELAADAELDLVEVAPNSKPPVCKVMDYGKYKYKMSKKAHDAKKKQKIIKVKEVKTTPKTEEHDYQFKLNHVKRFLADGDKVKVTVFFKGRLITHSELGLKILDRFVEDLADLAIVEQEPKKEGKTMALVLAPVNNDKAEKKSVKEKVNE